MKIPYIDQIRVGKVKQYLLKGENEYNEEMIKSPLVKDKIQGKVWVNQTGIIGDDGIDDQDIKRDKALFAYTKDTYHYWNHEQPQLQIGQMGEQLVVCHLNEYNTFIGDTFQVGEAIIQVSQPRLPCWRVAFHVGDVNFARKIIKSNYTGWHFRVLKEGFIQEKNELKLLERPYPEWSIAICNELLHTKNPSLKMLYELTTCHLLAERWLIFMKERLNGRVFNLNKRLFGPLKIT